MCATNNLMDYGDSSTLYKYQWDNIHDPESNFALFDEEGEGALDLIGTPEWLLQVYSPQISRGIRRAIMNNDIVEQRRLTYWALNNAFPDSWAFEFSEFGSYSNRAAKLTKYDPDHVDLEGLKLVLFDYFTVDGCITDNPDDAVEIRMSEEHFYPRGLSNPIVPDEAYPVDIFLYEGIHSIANGQTFYAEYDFQGYYAEGLYFMSGKGVIAGRMRGYGYIEYFVNYEDGLNFNPGVGWGVVLGHYNQSSTPLNLINEYPSGATPGTFTGNGKAISAGGITKWTSHEANNPNNIFWIGEAIASPINPFNLMTAIGMGNLFGSITISGRILVLSNFLDIGLSGFDTFTNILPNFAHQGGYGKIHYQCSDTQE